MSNPAQQEAVGIPGISFAVELAGWGNNGSVIFWEYNLVFLEKVFLYWEVTSWICLNITFHKRSFFFNIKGHVTQSCCTYYCILVAQMVKHLPAIQETRVQSLGWEDLLEKEMATHSSIPAWRIPGVEEPSRLQSMGSQSQTRLNDFTSHIPVVHTIVPSAVWDTR